MFLDNGDCIITTNDQSFETIEIDVFSEEELNFLLDVLVDNDEVYNN